MQVDWEGGEMAALNGKCNAFVVQVDSTIYEYVFWFHYINKVERAACSNVSNIGFGYLQHVCFSERFISVNRLLMPLISKCYACARQTEIYTGKFVERHYDIRQASSSGAAVCLIVLQHFGVV
jgi:hypothetical protein